MAMVRQQGVCVTSLRQLWVITETQTGHLRAPRSAHCAEYIWAKNIALRHSAFPTVLSKYALSK